VRRACDFVVGVIILEKKVSKSKSSQGKSESELFMWIDDEVDLIKSQGRGKCHWETCQSKYSDILDLSTAQCQYPSAENATQLGKEFPHKYFIYYVI
jgi:hypothetical protein